MIDLKLRIQKARKHAGCTQPQLSELIGVSHRTLTSYEKDASKVTVKIAQKIASVCKVDLTWLLTGQGEMTKSVAEISDAAEKYQKLVKQFKNPDRVVEVTERLVEIENIDQKLFDRVDSYIAGVHDAAKTIADNGENPESNKKRDS